MIKFTSRFQKGGKRMVFPDSLMLEKILYQKGLFIHVKYQH